ncbi:MAG: Hsp20/alpha crystallin family protein [Chloroflexota bacterium]|nr:Hsp20/alpha crystallin family protein [Chloroflexota bacterium]
MYVVRRTRPRDPERVQQEMEEVFRALMPARPSAAPGHGNLWRPPIEVFETDDALVVRAEIAGMSEDRLSVVVDGDLLSVRGERPDSRQHERRSYHEARIPYGAFGADVFIPFPVNADQTEAEYHNGFLRIVLPRLSPRSIVPRRPGEDGERGKGAR